MRKYELFVQRGASNLAHVRQQRWLSNDVKLKSTQPQHVKEFQKEGMFENKRLLKQPNKIILEKKYKIYLIYYSFNHDFYTPLKIRKELCNLLNTYSTCLFICSLFVLDNCAVIHSWKFHTETNKKKHFKKWHGTTFSIHMFLVFFN